MIQTVILAGGLGTRIKEYYPNTIKSLITFDGFAFIDYQLELLKKNGLSDIIICAGHGTHELLEHLCKREYGLHLFVSTDGMKPLGTGGAVKRALTFIRDEFMVINGDSYLDFDYKQAIDLFQDSNFKAGMTIYHNKNKYDKSNIEITGEKAIVYDKDNPSEKSEYIDYGASFFRKEAFENTGIRFDLSNLQKRLIEEQAMAFIEIPEEQRFYEIGSIEGIKEFQNYIRKNNVLK